ncbi:MAG: hypothetical protein ACRCX2_27480, partial [Paraclostridium sp.]
PDNIELFELSEENWQALLDMQSQGEEIRILNQFDYSPETREIFIPNIGGYKKPPIPEGMVKPDFDYKEEVWFETATREEELIDLKNKANAELAITDKFEEGAYRRRLSEEEKIEIDNYRDELLDIVETCNSDVYNISVGVVNLSLNNLPKIPERPEFTKRYDR